MKIFNKIIWVLLFAFSLLIVWINIQLHTDNFNKEERKADIILQLNFLKQEIKQNHLGERMQAIFPEGFVFTNALYGLSWCEVGLNDTSESIKKIALQEALFAYNQINSEKAKEPFDPTLNPKNGIFYLGWNNYLLSKILLLDSNFDQNKSYEKVFKNNCDLIVTAIQNSKSPFLQSYQNQTWPADMFVALASLSNHDRLFNKKFKSFINKWVLDIKSKVDPNTKLIPHKVNSTDGKTIEGARGCSISLILRLLAEIDYDFSLEQYKLYKKNFVSTTFGLPSIEEYPVGIFGMGDIDSGPVIFGVGFSGTIVSIGTLSVMGDYNLAEKQYKTINAFGLSYKSSNMKKYLFGQLPISDAFIAWSRTAQLHDPSNTTSLSNDWALKFHSISFLTLLVLWFIFYWKTIFKKFK